MDIGTLTGTVEIEDHVGEAFDKISESIKHFSEEFEGAMGAATLTVGVLVGAVGALSTAILGIGEHGSTILGIENAFDGLAQKISTTGDVLRGGLEEGLKGTVTELTSMQAIMRPLTAGVKLTSDDMTLLGQASREMGKATGTDATQGLETLSNALTTGNTRLLKRAGIIVDNQKAEKNFADSIHVTVDELNNAGKLEAHRIEILNQTREYVDRLGVSQLSLKERVQQAEVELETWGANLAKAVASSPNVMNALDAIGAAITKNFGGAGQTALEVIVGWINKFADAAATWGPYIIKTLADIWKWVVDIWHTVVQAWDLVPDWFKNIARDAGLAAGAIWLVHGAIGQTTGPDVLATLANFAQIWTVIGTNVSRTGEILKEWLLLITAFKWEALTLAVTTLSEAFIAFLATPVGIAAALVAVGFAAYRTTGFLEDLYSKWQKGQPMWDAFKQGGSFWNNSIIGRTLGMSKQEALPSTPMVIPGLVTPKGQTSTLGMNAEGSANDRAKFIKDQSAKIETVTNASIVKTEQLWDEYFSITAKMDGDSLQSKLDNIDRWYAGQQRALDKTAKLNKDFQNQQQALDSVYYAKRLDAEVEFMKKSIEASEAIGKAGQDAVSKGLAGGQNVLQQLAQSGAQFTEEWDQLETPLLNVDTGLTETVQLVHALTSGVPLAATAIKGLNTNSHLVATTSAEAGAEIANAMTTAAKSYLPLTDANRKLADQMLANGVDAQVVAKTFNTSVENILHNTNLWGAALDMLATEFTQLGQIAGGSLGSIFSGIGQIVTQLSTANKMTSQIGLNGKVIGGSFGAASVIFSDNATNYQKAAAGIAGAAAIAQGAINVWNATSASKNVGMNALGGAEAGAQAGAVFGPWGIAIGAAAGLVTGLIRGKPAWAKAADEVAKDFGTKISDTLAKTIADSAQADFGGSRQASAIAHLSDIIKEAGGLNTQNLDTMTGKLRDVFSMIETHQMTMAQGLTVLDDNWQAFATAGTDATGRISAGLKDIIALNERFGTQSKEIAAWQAQQGSNALDAFVKVVAGQKTAIEGYDTLKTSVDDTTKAAQVLGTVDVTSGLMDIIGKMGGSELDALKKGFAKATQDGFVGTLTDFLKQQATLYQFAQEGDTRFTTWLSGSTIKAFNTLQSKAGGVLSGIIDKMGSDERKALQSGFVDAVKAGFQGTVADFLAQQAALYQSAQEGDARLKTWLSGSTIDLINATGPAKDFVNALAAQQQAAETAKQGLKDLGIQAIATFSAAVASGMSMTDAINKVHPALQSLQKEYDDLGLKVDDVGVKTLLFTDKIVSGSPELVDAISGLSGEMVSLDNLGLLNKDTFSAIERTGAQMYGTLLNKAIDATGGYDTVTGAIIDMGDAQRITLGQMQQYLHDAQTQAALLGVPLDDNTQRLIDQSKDLGIWKDKGKTATDIMIESMGKLVDKVQLLIDTLNHVPTKVATDVTVTTTQVDTGTPEPPIRAATGFHGRVSSQTEFIAGEAGSPEDVDITPVGARKLATKSDQAALDRQLTSISIGGMHFYFPEGTNVNDKQALAHSMSAIVQDDIGKFRTGLVQLIDARVP